MDENSTNKINETNTNNEINEEIKRGGEYPTRAIEQLTPGVAKFDPNMRAVYAGPQILTPANQTPNPRMKPSFEIPPHGFYDVSTVTAGNYVSLCGTGSNERYETGSNE